MLSFPRVSNVLVFVITFVVISVVLLEISDVSALKCLECQGATCEDKAGGKKVNCSKPTLPNGEVVCFRMTEEDALTTKGCVELVERQKMPCKGGRMANTCNCDKDFCNK